MGSAIHVNTTQTLQEAIRDAKAGDVIQIAAGKYDFVNISGKTHLTLQAADPNDRPQLQRINIFESQQIELIQLIIGAEQFDRQNNTAIGINASYTQNLLLLDLEIRNARDAIGIRYSSNVEISRNNIHDIERDGLSVLSTQDLLIRDNTFTAFHPNYDSVLYEDWYFDEFSTAYLPDQTTLADHADFIQLTDSEAITIQNNTLDATGGAWTQSIFIQGGHHDKPVVITDNVIKNGHEFGIRVINQDQVQTNNNQLTQIDTQGITGLPANFAPRVNITTYDHEDVWIVKDGERMLLNVKNTDVEIPPTNASEVVTRPIEADTNHINCFLFAIPTALSHDVSIQYETRDGTAIAGEDYIASSGTATLKAGETQIAIAVEIIGDKQQEEDETFFLVATQVTGALFPNNVTELLAMHTIIDDDIPLEEAALLGISTPETEIF